MVLFPGEFRISRSLRRSLRSGRFEVKLDSDFPAVIRACAEVPRAGQNGTWITPEMQHAYWQLFQLGVAHSVETWMAGKLVGGLYGLAIGRMFYGESMFAQVSDASKVAAAHLARFLEEEGFGMVDCQMNTAHLASLGAREIPRAVFMARLRALVAAGVATWPMAGRWRQPSLDLRSCLESTIRSCPFRCCSSMPRRPTPAATCRRTGAFAGRDTRPSDQHRGLWRTRPQRFSAQRGVHLPAEVRRLSRLHSGATAGRVASRRTAASAAASECTPVCRHTSCRSAFATNIISSICAINRPGTRAVAWIRTATNNTHTSCCRAASIPG
jgi:leucyl/phenylalanyl-tRNA--protein transferase